MPKLSSAELAKREDVIQKMKKNKRSLVKLYGPDAEKVMYGRATNIAKKVAESEMEKSNLKELVRAALMKEKAGFSKEYDNDPALKGGQKNLPDGLQRAIISKVKGKIKEALNQAIVLTDKDYKNLMKNGSVAKTINGQTVVVSLENFPINMEDADYEDPRLDEDLDLGHEDDEPHMLKSELYRIGKYAMELYQMVDQFEGEGEVDFPAWWQAKITTAKNMVSSAKHYLEFELKEPEIDAMVGVATGEDIIPNTPSEPLEDEIEEEISAEERLAAAIQKALNKNKSADDQNNIKQARKAMNDGNIEAAKKILQPYLEEGNLGHNELASLEKEGGSWIVTYRTMDGKKEKVFTDEDEARAFMNTTLEEGLPKGYFKKATAELDESFEKLVGKLKKGGKSEKAAKAIAGAVANYKAKGGGKGPTAKQKARG